MSSNLQSTNQLDNFPFYAISNADEFICQSAKLSQCYEGLEEILGINTDNPIFKVSDEAVLVSESYLDDEGVFHCSPLVTNLNLELQQNLFYKIYEKWLEKKVDAIQLDIVTSDDYLNAIGFNPQTSIWPNQYALHEERLPDWINHWIAVKWHQGYQGVVLLKYKFLTALGVNTPEKNITYLRRYLEQPKNFNYQVSELPNSLPFLKNTLIWASHQQLEFSGNDDNLLNIVYSIYNKILSLSNEDNLHLPLLKVSGMNQTDVTYTFENNISNNVEKYSYNLEDWQQIQEYEINFVEIFRVLQNKGAILVNKTKYPKQFSFDDFKAIEIKTVLDINLLEQSAVEIDEAYYTYWKRKIDFKFTIKYYQKQEKLPYLLKFENVVVKKISDSDRDIDINEATKTIYVTSTDKNIIDDLLQSLVNNSSFDPESWREFTEAKSRTISEIDNAVAQERDREDLYEQSFFQKRCHSDDFDENRSDVEMQEFANALLNRLEQQKSSWQGYIYHFTHVENAASILNGGSLLSRGLLDSNKFKDSAGQNLINRTSSTIKRDFARFYFRPKTPTQWHNELLGRRTGSIHALCPVPIFLCFKIKDVLRTHKARCAVSNGNLATNWAHYGNSLDFLKYFNFENVYNQYGSSPHYKTASQQEFIVKNGLNFLEYNIEMKVVCRNEQDKQVLLSLLDSNQNYKIEVNRYYYENSNPHIKVDLNQQNQLGIQLLGWSHNINGIVRCDYEQGISQIASIDSRSDISVKLQKGLSVESRKHISLTFKSQLSSGLKVLFVENDKEWLIYQKS